MKESGDKQEKIPLLVLLGPTSIGKTALSLELARLYNGEIISGDSMQVYRGMDIGTAKLPLSQREGIPHHLIDIRDPGDGYSVADFQAEATACIHDIHSRGKLPMIVGGTGLYLNSVCYSDQYKFADTGWDEAFREEKERFVQEHGVDLLYQELVSVDPVAAESIHPNNYRRVIRALEVCKITGGLFSEQRRDDTQERHSPYNLCLIGLTMDRQRLYDRIEQRVDDMISAGLVEEVRGLLSTGLDKELIAMQALGYKEFIAYFQNRCTLEEAILELKKGTRRFAKRQLSWFRTMPDIAWIDVEQNFNKYLDQIRAIIAGKIHDDIEYR